jgi:hypothetical protein
MEEVIDPVGLISGFRDQIPMYMKSIVPGCSSEIKQCGEAKPGPSRLSSFNRYGQVYGIDVDVALTTWP